MKMKIKRKNITIKEPIRNINAISSQISRLDIAFFVSHDYEIARKCHAVNLSWPARVSFMVNFIAQNSLWRFMGFHRRPCPIEMYTELEIETSFLQLTRQKVYAVTTFLLFRAKSRSAIIKHGAQRKSHFHRQNSTPEITKKSTHSERELISR